MNIESFFLLLTCQTLSIIIAIIALSKIEEWNNRNKRK
jgi:hypothetical protein